MCSRPSVLPPLWAISRAGACTRRQMRPNAWVIVFGCTGSDPSMAGRTRRRPPPIRSRPGQPHRPSAEGVRPRPTWRARTVPSAGPHGSSGPSRLAYLPCTGTNSCNEPGRVTDRSPSEARALPAPAGGASHVWAALPQHSHAGGRWNPLPCLDRASPPRLEPDLGDGDWSDQWGRRRSPGQ